ncbi:MAG TPA: hypothetical protein VF689_07020, partial [Allosphingosinicella sp.]
MEETEIVEVRRRRRWPMVLAAFLLIAVLALLVLWLLRYSIAADYIDREFARRGVQATYKVKRIGLHRQRLEDLVIGDPNRPDLTARWVEVELSWGFTGPSVSLITARGVRLYGKVQGRRVTLGQVDRLLPPPTGAPFRLPDQRINVADAAIVLETPGGRVGIALAGRGNLSNGFRGHLAAVSRGLRFRDCRLAAPSAVVGVAVDRHRPTFDGPLSFDGIACGNSFDLTRPNMALNVTLSEAFNSWRGTGRVEAPRMRAGPNILAGMGGRLTFSGDITETRGAVDVAAARAAIASFRAARTRVSGDYSLSLDGGRFALDGQASMRGFTVGAGTLRPLLATLRSGDGTPIGPIGRALADSLLRAATGGGDLAGRVTVVNREDGGAARFDDLGFSARSGARLRVTGGSGITYSWPGGRIQTDGDFAVSGGGLPDARFALRQARPGGPIQGVGRIAPMSSGASRLALGEVRFTAEPSGATRLETVATVDGAFRGGRVDGLSIPVRGRFGGGGFAFGEGCVEASFRRLRIEDLAVGPGRLPLCPTGRALVWKAPGGPVQGGAEIRSPRFAGRLGASPVAITARRMRFNLA